MGGRGCKHVANPFEVTRRWDACGWIDGPSKEEGSHRSRYPERLAEAAQGGTAYQKEHITSATSRLPAELGDQETPPTHS